MPSFCVPKNSSFTTRSGSFFAPAISNFRYYIKGGFAPSFFLYTLVAFSFPSRLLALLTMRYSQHPSPGW